MILILSTTDKLWDQEFRSHEASIVSDTPANAVETQSHRPQDADELSRTAGLLIQSVSHESNPKFKNSQFLGLMRQLRDREMVVEGNDLVQSSESSGLVGAGTSGWAADFTSAARDVKGKGRAVDSGPLLSDPTHAPFPASWYQSGQASRPYVTDGMDASATNMEDPNEAYFRQDNEEYIEYWKNAERARGDSVVDRQKDEWAHLQKDWDRFEATASGIRPLANYQFQAGNPYLLGEASVDRTHTHMMHEGTDRPASFYEVGFYMATAFHRLTAL